MSRRNDGWMVASAMALSFMAGAAAASAQGHTIATVAGTGDTGFNGDGGAAVAATLFNPQGVAVDAEANTFIADLTNRRVRRIDAVTGIITTVAGNGDCFYNGDGIPATSAALCNPIGVAVDSAGNLYVAQGTSINRIRRVDRATGIITTVAGSGLEGFGGDGGPATSAMLFGPFGVAVDTAGNLCIGDTNNRRVRRVSAATGVITTIAGNGGFGFSGDGGPGPDATLTHTMAVAMDHVGNCYFVDFENRRIRRVDVVTGTIGTVAGTGDYVFNGDGIPATSAGMEPRGVFVDPAGNLLIADPLHNRVRRIDSGTGLIATIAGNGSAGFRGDGGLATQASLLSPTGLAADVDGSVLFSDTDNQRVRRVSNTRPIADAGSDQTIVPGASATLDARGSSDADGDALQFEWRDETGAVIGSTATVNVAPPLGAHEFTVSVVDRWAPPSTAHVTIIVAPPPPPSVDVLAPAGGQVLAALPYTIRWTAASSGTIAKLDVSFSVDAGRTFAAIPECSGLSGGARSCVWNNPGPVATDAVMRIVASDSLGQIGQDTSAFSIVAATIRVNSPEDSSVWRIGTTESIIWTHNLGTAYAVNIEVSRDGGMTWATIALGVDNTAASSSFNWSVSGPRTKEAVVRISAVMNPAVADRSERFKIR